MTGCFVIYFMINAPLSPVLLFVIYDYFEIIFISSYTVPLIDLELYSLS